MNKFFVTVLLLAVCLCIDAQTVRRIDPSRLKGEIVYPPLTEREGKDLTLPVPPSEHPRLFFRKSDIATIKRNVQHPLLKESWEKVNKSANFATDGKLKQGVAHNVDMQIINAIEAKALMYALNGDKKMGSEAVDLIFNLLNTIAYSPDKQDVTRDRGRTILATSVVYDWCYDLIAPDEKKMLIAGMESLAVDMEIKWPQLVQGSIGGHGVEAQMARDMISFGIAACDENPEIYRRVAGRIFAELIPAQNYWYLSGHHHQGSAYGPSRFRWEVWTTLIFDRMGYPNITSKLQGKMPYRWIYTRRPDGQLFRDGDDFLEKDPFGKYWTLPDFAYAASYYQDPLLMGEAIKQKVIGQTPLYDLLLIDPTVPANRNFAALPLTKYFPYPMGSMVARTGWDEGLNSGTAVAEMKIVERFFAGHQHLDAGSFQIYYKGPLAVESGIYQGTEGKYGGEHFRNYYMRTIAHNCMLVYDTAEEFVWRKRPVVNDGGQRMPRGGVDANNIDVVKSEEHKMGEVQAYDFGPDPVKPEYSYLKGDITGAYTGKVKNHQRAFVFLNLNNSDVPAALIVYDYVVTANKDVKKIWLLHSVQEPSFNGNVCTVVRNEKGYNGKLVNTILLPLPQNTLLQKLGGQGKEFYVGGTNFPQGLREKDHSGDGAAWRIKLSPKTPSETDVFLNVMQVTDAENNTLLPVEKIETEQLTGVQIGDRIVLFAKNGNPVNRPINLTIPPIGGKEGGFKVLITDLEKGNWAIAGPKSSEIIKNENNLVYFQATTGNYVITKK